MEDATLARQRAIVEADIEQERAEAIAEEERVLAELAARREAEEAEARAAEEERLRLEEEERLRVEAEKANRMKQGKKT